MSDALIIAYGIGALIAAWTYGYWGAEFSLALVARVVCWPIMLPLLLV